MQPKQIHNIIFFTLNKLHFRHKHQLKIFRDINTLTLSSGFYIPEYTLMSAVIFIFNTHTCTWAEKIVPFDRENLRTLSMSVRPVWPIQFYCEIHKAHKNIPCGEKNSEILC